MMKVWPSFRICFVTAICFLPVLAVGGEKSRVVVNGYLGPPTFNTCYWTEREFKDVPERGPASAAGIVLWSHGLTAAQPSWHLGAPPVIRLFAEASWDVLLVQRNQACEGPWVNKGKDYIDNLVNEVDEANKSGYRRILVAGQSVGAGTALGAAGKTDRIDGVLAFALSHGRGVCRDPRTFRPSMIAFHEREIKSAIQESRSQRILISMGKDDHCVGHSFTPLIAATLAAREIGYIHLDESMVIPGHHAVNSKKFAALYGGCILKFFSDERAAPGRHSCIATGGR